MTEITAARAYRHSHHTRKGLMHYVDLYRQRQALAALDNAALRDIGLTREDARSEATRPIWDAPSYWGR